MKINQEVLRTKTIILGLSSTVNANGQEDLNSHVSYNGVKVPFVTQACILMAATGRKLPRNEEECALAVEYLKGVDKQAKLFPYVVPASRAWKPADKWDNAITLIGWDKITKSGNVLNANILINLSKIAPELFPADATTGKDVITTVHQFDMGLANGTLDETGVQILREWEALANKLGIEKVKLAGGGYKFNTKNVRYQPDWQDAPRGLPYPSFRFTANSAMFITIKWKLAGENGRKADGWGRTAIPLFTLDGKPITKEVKNKLTGAVTVEQRQKPGFGMIGESKFIPFTWDSQTCRDTYSSFYSFVEEWAWEGDATYLAK